MSKISAQDHPTLSPKSSKRSFEINLAQYRERSSATFPEEVIFLLTHSNLQFDWKRKKVLIENIVELEEFYRENYDDENFPTNLRTAQNIIDTAIIQSAIDLSKLDDIRIYPANPAIKRTSDIKKSHFSYSAKRSSFSQTAAKHKMTDRTKDAVTHLLIDSVMIKIFEMVGIDPVHYQGLPPKISEAPNFAGYLRDDLIVIGDELYYSPISDEEHLKVKTQRTKSAMADVKAAGFDAKLLPFVTEGGNIISCKDREGNDTLLIAVSDVNFNLHDEFVGAKFHEEGEAKPRFYENYEEFCQRLQVWGEELGYRTIIIHRNLDRTEWRDDKNPSNVHALYHADTFLNVADDVLLLPEEDVITRKNRDELIAAFGEKNIIRMDKQSRKKMAANFVMVGNHIIFSNPNISRDIIDGYCQRGFNCVVPPFELTLCGTDGIRCHTQEIPSSVLEKQSAAEATRSSLRSSNHFLS